MKISNLRFKYFAWTVICGCILSGCSVVSDVVGNGESNALQTWSELVITENAYSYSELSVLPEGVFAVMAAPKLRLFKFDKGWTEVSTGQFEVPDNFPEYIDLDWDITIQSALITDDSALDFVVRYDPAPWDVLNVPNQGRSWGTVISGQGGQWKSVEFTDPYGDGVPYSSIEYIEYVQLALALAVHLGSAPARFPNPS